MHAAAPHSQWIGLISSIAVVSIILFFRIRRMGRVRRLRLETLWIVPVLYSLVAAWLLWHLPPHGMVWLYCLVALCVGGVLGWKWACERDDCWPRRAAAPRPARYW